MKTLLDSLLVVGTWAIAALAIWGDQIRSFLVPIKLRLVLLNDTGDFTTQNLVVDPNSSQQFKIVEARYYHLLVTNTVRFPQAHDVQILVTALSLRGPGGEQQRVFTGALPLSWRHGQLYPIARTIGPKTEAEADLLFVRDGLLQINLLLVPNNFPATFSGETHIWLTVVARGLEGESTPLRLKIDWDGVWDRGETEMKRHLTISPA